MIAQLIVVLFWVPAVLQPDNGVFVGHLYRDAQMLFSSEILILTGMDGQEVWWRRIASEDTNLLQIGACSCGAAEYVLLPTLKNNYKNPILVKKKL